MSLSLLRNPRGLAGVLALLVAIHGASAAASTAGDTTFVGDFEAQGRVLREFGSRVLPITSLSDGGDGFFVFWNDVAMGVLRFDHYDPEARLVTGWPDTGRVLQSSAGTTDHQFVVDGSGGFYHAWSTTIAGDRIYEMQRHDGEGNPALGWDAGPRPIASDSTQLSMKMVPDAEGGIWIAWVGARRGDRSHGYVRHVASNGDSVAGWPNNGIRFNELYQNTSTSSSSMSINALIARPLERVFIQFQHVVTCSSHGCAGWAANRAVQVDANGIREWTGYSPELRSSKLQPDSGRGVYDLFCWAGQWILVKSEGGPPELYLWEGTIHPAGNGDILYFRTSTQRYTRLGPDFVAWDSWGGIAGLKVIAAYPSSIPKPLPDGTGGFWFAWDERPYPYTTQAQKVTLLRGDGSYEPGWSDSGLVVYATQDAPDLIGLHTISNRRLQILWSSGYSAPFRWLAQRISPAQTVPTLVSLVSSNARAGLVSLEWYAADDEGLPLSVERSENRQEWRMVATVLADGAGLVRFEDREVRAGANYGYRLRDSHRAFSETWVLVPQPAVLTIRSAHESGPGRVRVEFTAEVGVGTEVLLFDVSGRRLGRVRVVPASDAIQVCEVTVARSLSPGLYLTRVDSGGQRAHRRFVITH